MDLTLSTIMTIAGYLVSVGCLYGALSTKITMLTKQVEKHNSVIERTFKLEEKVDGIKEEINIYHGGEK